MGIFIGGPLDGQDCEYYAVRGDEVISARHETPIGERALRPGRSRPNKVEILYYRRRAVEYEFTLYDTFRGDREVFYVLSTFTEDEALSRCEAWITAHVCKQL